MKTIKELYKKLFINSRHSEIQRKKDSLSLNFFNDSFPISSPELKELWKERKGIINEINKEWLTNDKFLNTVMHWDCLDYLYQIESDSIDLFLSDIPYWINLDSWDVFHQNTNSSFLWTPSEAQMGKGWFKKRWKPLNGWNEEDKENNQKYEEWIAIWANMLFPIMKEWASLFIFWWRRTIHKAMNALESAWFIPKDMLFWEKNNFNYRNQSLIKTVLRRWNFKITLDWINKIRWLNNIGLIIEYLSSRIDYSYKNSKDFISELDQIDKTTFKSFTYEILEAFQSDAEIIKIIEEWQWWKVWTLAPKIEPIAWLIKPYQSVTILDNIIKNNVWGINIGANKINGKEPTNLLNINFNKTELWNKIHEAQKPINLIKFLINLTTKEWAIVLDPFMWSWTTAVASVELKRNYIGFERDELIFNDCMNRINTHKAI